MKAVMRKLLIPLMTSSFVKVLSFRLPSYDTATSACNDPYCYVYSVSPALLPSLQSS